MTRQVIIVAGGSGTRMNASQPKQFMLLGGKPILMHSIEKFYRADPKAKIVVVLPESQIATWEALCSTHEFAIPHHVVKGGSTRFESVKNGLTQSPGAELTTVHDGVRPLITSELIKSCFRHAEKNGNAVPCLPVLDSLRERSGEQNRIADRNSFVIVQTPQCFRTEILSSAYRSAASDSFTDDASVVEAFGEKIHLIEGERENLKITFSSDIAIAEPVLARQS